MSSDIYDKEGLARRTRAFRELHGLSQMEWAKFTGIPYKKWNHYERGYPLSREALFQLYSVMKGRNTVKLSADWLYWGELYGLTVIEARQLDEQVKKVLKNQRNRANRFAQIKVATVLLVRERIPKRDRKPKKLKP